MNKLNKIFSEADVEGFCIFNKSILTFYGENFDNRLLTLISRETFSREKILETATIFKINYFNEDSFGIIGLGTSSLFDMNTKTLKQRVLPLVDVFYDGLNNIVISANHKTEQLCAVNPRNENILWTKQGLSGRFFLINSCLIYVLDTLKYDKTIIKAIDIKTGENLWERKLIEIVESSVDNPKQVVSFLGCWNNQFIFETKGNNIFHLDIKTGETLKKWSPDVSLPVHLVSRRNNIVLEENKIAGLADFSYWELNLDTREVEVVDLKNSLKELNLQIVETTLKGNYIYFNSEVIEAVKGQRRGLFHYTLGVFDRTTRKVTWRHNFEGIKYTGFFQVTPPIVDDQYIYVKGADKVLHVFERPE